MKNNNAVKSSPVTPKSPESGTQPTLTQMSAADLKAMQTALRDEQRRRKAEAQAKMPQAGEKVRITGGAKRDIGKVGEVIAARQTRLFLKIPGQTNVPYVLVTDVERVTA